MVGHMVLVHGIEVRVLVGQQIMLRWVYELNGLS
jgi:hypothetical protein